MFHSAIRYATMVDYIYSASEYAKKCGLMTLQEACEITGVKHSTLYRWFRSKPMLFKAVVKGAAMLKGEK